MADVLPAQRPSQDSNVRLVFACPACGKTLTADLLLADTTGPCPQCGQPVTAPQPRWPAGFQAPSAAPSVSLGIPLSSPTGTERPPASQRVRRGRIHADSALDHNLMDQREAARNLWVITFFILTFCAVIAVTWFMRKWIG